MWTNLGEIASACSLACVDLELKSAVKRELLSVQLNFKAHRETRVLVEPNSSGVGSPHSMFSTAASLVNLLGCRPNQISRSGAHGLRNMMTAYDAAIYINECITYIYENSGCKLLEPQGGKHFVK